jgi:toxin ParE1/3/4
MAEIILSYQAKTDLDNIYEYIFQDSPLYAQRQVEKIFNRLNRISNSIQTGRIIPELNIESIREVFEGNYRIIYRIISTNKVEVVPILHTARFFDKDSIL